MPLAPPPTWLIYPGAVAGLLLAALAIRPHTDAPAPPPPVTSGEGAVLAQATTPFDALSAQRVQRAFGGEQVTAFAVGDGGVWLAPAGLARACAHPALLVGGGQGVPATARPTAAGSELAVFTTHGGAPAALPLAEAPPEPDALAYIAGYPHGRSGEVAMRLLGPEALPVHDGARPSVTVLAWAVIGRTDDLGGDLTGMAGAPALDASGRVVGVVVGEQPRRGRIYTTSLADIATALRAAAAQPSATATGEPITRANYGLAADDLRRSWRVVPAVCATG
jgi:serine protease Do